jgi:hypothetical protein
VDKKHNTTEKEKDQKHEIKIFIGGKEYDVETRHMNGIQIKMLGGIHLNANARTATR